MGSMPADESVAERKARALAALRAATGSSSLPMATARPAPKAAAGALAPDLDDATREILQGLDLHRRRYGLAHPSRAALRKMGCRTIADACAVTHQRCVDWLGYREADAVRERLEAIVSEARSGAREPGVTRMLPGLDPETREWLLERPVEDVAGRGIAAKVAAALRAAGHVSLGALAAEEADEVEDIHGIGRATVDALRARLAGIVAEGSDTAARRRRINLAAADADWDAAAPEGG